MDVCNDASQFEKLSNGGNVSVLTKVRHLESPHNEVGLVQAMSCYIAAAAKAVVTSASKPGSRCDVARSPKANSPCAT